jgi:hypothetical protein
VPVVAPEVLPAPAVPVVDDVAGMLPEFAADVPPVPPLAPVLVAPVSELLREPSRLQPATAASAALTAATRHVSLFVFIFNVVVGSPIVFARLRNWRETQCATGAPGT